MSENKRYSVAVHFEKSDRSYYFVSEDHSLKIGDQVICETIRGIELGRIASKLNEIEGDFDESELRPVLRKAIELDLERYEQNIVDAEEAYKIAIKEVKKLNLPMKLTMAEYTLDRNKLQFDFAAEERVDFRELAKRLASIFHTRIELRQIGPRDRAKATGGLGVCGLKLCCSLFLNEFDGISINRAKNQMLALNIPKLSGACGKLICCLKYEDEQYSELKKYYPRLGEKIKIEDNEYHVSSINVLSRTVKIENIEDVKILDLDEYNKLSKGKKIDDETLA